MKFQMEAIGQVSSSRSEVRDDQWDQERAVITLDPALFTEEALWGLAVQPCRPNRIGTTIVQIRSVGGLSLEARGPARLGHRADAWLLVIQGQWILVP
ncbi:hypothetical protein LJ754_10475 [Arthrobacter sp. zg-Y40]|uniref:hypothetical protein n=1 Tax=Arthrobacter sp. zg-Y40 TaxID=2886939 RepID=UPI001D14B552|nr:hypothetical protein [Arthrobacter sp. zg-Y40]MCC3279574.1 hypothetical protein [Arthrobacter sp. zg-Y40]